MARFIAAQVLLLAMLIANSVGAQWPGWIEDNEPDSEAMQFAQALSALPEFIIAQERKIVRLEGEVSDLESTVASQLAQIVGKDATIAEQNETIAFQAAAIAALEAELANARSERDDWQDKHEVSEAARQTWVERHAEMRKERDAGVKARDLYWGMYQIASQRASDMASDLELSEAFKLAAVNGRKFWYEQATSTEAQLDWMTGKYQVQVAKTQALMGERNEIQDNLDSVTAHTATHPEGICLRSEPKFDPEKNDCSGNSIGLSLPNGNNGIRHGHPFYTYGEIQDGFRQAGYRGYTGWVHQDARFYPRYD